MLAAYFTYTDDHGNEVPVYGESGVNAWQSALWQRKYNLTASQAENRRVKLLELAMATATRTIMPKRITMKPRKRIALDALKPYFGNVRTFDDLLRWQDEQREEQRNAEFRSDLDAAFARYAKVAA